MNKRLIQKAVLLLSLLILCAVSGCAMAGDASEFISGGSFVEDTVVSAKAETGSVVFEASPAEPVYPLTTTEAVVSITYPQYAQWELTATQQMISVLEETTGVTIQLDGAPVDSYGEQIRLKVNSGALGDLTMAVPDALLSSDWTANFQPLNDLIMNYAPNYIQAANAFSGGVQALVEMDGTVMQLYRFFDEPQFFSSIGVVIREDWLTELGFPPPETYDEYHDLLLAMKTQYDVTLPFWLPVSGVAPGDCFTAGFGISLGSQTVNDGFYQEDGVVKFGALEDGFEDYVTMMHSWYEEGLITAYYQDQMDLYSTNYLLDLSLGETSGVFFVPISSYTQLEDLCSFPITPGMDPVRTAGDWTHLASGYATSIAGDGFSIASSCADPELAMQVADWFYSQEAVWIGDYGAEGKTYVLEDGQPVFTDLILDNPQGLSAQEALMTYTVYNLQGITSAARLPYLQADIVDVLEAWVQQKDTAHMLPAELLLTVDEGEEYTAIMADISTCLDNAVARLVSGDLPLTAIPEVRDDLHAMDIDRALELWQTALDRFR